MKTSNLIKYLGGGAALLVAFYALFGFYGVPELAKWGLQKYGAKFDANLSVGEVKFNPFTFELNVTDARLSKGEKIASFARLDADFDVYALPSKTLRVKDLNLEEPFFKFEIDERGAHNLAFFVSEEAEAKIEKAEQNDFKFEIDRVRVRAANAEFADRESNTSVSAAIEGLAFWRLDSNLTAMDLNDTNVTLSSLVAAFGDMKASAKGLKISLDNLAGDYENVKFDANKLALSAGKADFAMPRLSADISGFSADLAGGIFSPDLINSNLNLKINATSVKMGADAYELSNLNLGDAALNASGLVVKPKIAFDAREFGVSGTKVKFENVLASLANLGLKNIKFEMKDSFAASVGAMSSGAVNASVLEDKAGFGSLAASGLAVSENSFALENIEVGGAFLSASASEEGLSIANNWVKNPAPKSAQKAPAKVVKKADKNSTKAATSTFKYQIKNASLKDASATIKDPFATNIISGVNVRASNIADGGAISFAAHVADPNIKLDANGTVDLGAPKFNSNLKLNIANIALATPYLKEFLNIKDVSGGFDFTGALAYETDASVKGKLDAKNFALKDLGGDKVVGFDTLATEFALNGDNINVSRLNVVKPDVKLAVSKNQELNLAKLVKESKSAKPAPKKAAKTANKPAKDPNITLRKIGVKNGILRFSDDNISFHTKITRIGASINEIRSNRRSNMVFRASLPKQGFSEIFVSGYAFHPEKQTDIRLRFKNFGLSAIDRYFEHYLGYELAGGRLNLDINYTIQNGKLLGSNNINLDNIELGESRPSDVSLDLPLKFALYILKDSDNQIDLDLGISGDMNDPDFSYGGIVIKAIVKILTDVVTSPFRFVGGLFADDEGGTIKFPVGTSTALDWKTASFVKLTTDKPELVLSLAPVYNEDADSQAIAEFRVEHKIAEAINKHGDTYADAVKRLFGEANLGKFEEEGAAKAALVRHEKTLIAKEDLSNLARRRAEKFKFELTSHGVKDAQINVREIESVSGGDKNVKMDVGLNMK